MTAYLHHRVVRFGDCDPAGIAYFPRFFDWFHQAMESWFDDELGQPYAAFLQRYGLPAVHSECDWRAPCGMGEHLVIALTVGEIGRSSLRLDYEVRGPDGGVRATAHTRVVLMGTDPAQPDFRRSVPLPADLRERAARFVPAP